MISRFGFKNFFSFKEGGEINFTLDNSTPEDIRAQGQLSTVIGIKGANASGKTNIIKAIEFLQGFCTKSANNDEQISIRSHFDNDEPSEFYVDLIIAGTEYTYELSVDRNHVHHEIIYKKISRKTFLLKRELNKLTKCASDFKELKNIQLRSNASILSMLNQYKFTSDMQELHEIRRSFSRILTNVSQYGYHDHFLDTSDLSKEYKSDPKLFDFLKNILLDVDPSIHDIKIFNTEKDGKDFFFPLFMHKVNSEIKSLHYHEQSSGMQFLYKKLYLFWLVLHAGGLLALDEFDIHLHALILPKLLKLFTDKNINNQLAQFIFTAHNTEIIDSLGKYRTILADKNGNESYCYRLDEISGGIIRNDRSIVPLYLKGKIGGVPLNE